MDNNSSLPIGALLAVCFSSNLACTPPATNASRVRTTQTPAATTTVADGDWASYNRTLIGDRFSPLNQVRTENAINLKQVCAFDPGEAGNFQSGTIVINNTLYATTDTHTFAIDPAACQQKWKQHYENPTPEDLRVNRGVAFADVFRESAVRRAMVHVEGPKSRRRFL